MKRRLSVKQAAELLGAPEQLVRVGLQQGMFPWGVAMKRSSRYTYYINAVKFEECTGIKIKQDQSKAG